VSLNQLSSPDRNKDDDSAKERFQRIGAAWETVERYFENPRWGEERGGGGGFYADDDDDEYGLDEDEISEFFQ
jgi:DnaJ-class molecular chaperone